MAEKMTPFLNPFLDSLSKKRTLSVLAVLVLSLIGFGGLILWNSQPDYQVVFSNLSPEDAGEMTNKLKDKKIPFQLSNSGTALLVPKDQVYDVRLSLATEGLPRGGGVGFEVFDRTNLGTTDFVQKLNYQRALQGELSRTIRQIKEVEQARVHIVTPKESLFVEEQKRPTASVFIKTRSGMTLGAFQVEGIVHLMASSVEGLEPGNITVVDTSGKVLSKRSDNTPMSQLTTTQLDYQRTIEEGLKKKVQGMLEEVLGPNKAIARVSTEIDFQQVDITEERYDPSTVVRSEQKNTERSSAPLVPAFSGEIKAADSKTAKGKAGAAPTPESIQNSPPPASPSLNANTSERQYEVRNYEISRVNKHIKDPTGKVRKVSVAVIVDGAYKEGTDAKGGKGKQYVPRSQEEMKNFESIVKNAIGFSEERKDQVEVINMPFYGSVVDEEVKSEKQNVILKEYLPIAYKPMVSFILVFLFIIFVVRPLLKRRSLSGEGEPALVSQTSPHLVSVEPAHVPKPIDLRSQTIQLTQGDPSKTIGIVKAWLREGE
ncbi:MAG TPA: flagellar basal-body MS-ring/collar protein FliF [Thermodesulfobacteriota bacterium]|nr:flagellar basal-body MS-ring/collar protein FliF [Thermodesulfobacteriota bacterium]